MDDRLGRPATPIGPRSVRTRSFVPADVVVAAFAGAPPIDARRLRDDLDRFVDNDLTPPA